MIRHTRAAAFEDLAPFFARLEAASALTDDDRQALFSACGSLQSIEKGKDVVRADNTFGHVHVMLSGWATQQVLLRNGSRQIVSLHLPGDLAGEGKQLTNSANHGTVALTDVRVACLEQRRLDALLSERQGLADAFRRARLIDVAVLHAWLVSLGRRTAYERLAHLFCELHARLEIVGLIQEGAFDWPLTQYDLADALGLTAVHTNRTLQALRHAGLVEITKAKRMRLRSLTSLHEAAGFDPQYVHASSIRQPSI